MLKRSLYTFFAAAAISAPAMMVPALVTPAAAQANLEVSIGIPGAVEVVPVARPGYLWQAGYWRWDRGHRYWERGYWRDEHRHYWH